MSKNRATGEPAPDYRKISSFLILCLFFVILVRDINAPGITWDESIYIPASVNYISWFSQIRTGLLSGSLREALSHETIHLHWRLNWEHPPLAKYFSAVSMHLFHGLTDPVSAARFASAALFILTIAVTMRLAGKLYGFYPSVFSGFFLFIMPRVFGHARLASLDMCLTFSWVLAAYLFFLSQENRRRVIPAGLALGMAFLTKLNGITLFPTLLLWSRLYRRKSSAKNLLIMGAIASAAAYIFWPWLWHSPLRKIIGYVGFHFGREYIIPVFYLGRTYSAHPAPFHYPFVLTLLTLPPAAVVAGGYKLIRAFKDRLKNEGDGFIIVNAAVPVLILALPGIAKYDGIRLFLPAFPFIAVLAGAGLHEIILKARARVNGKAVVILIILSALAGALPIFSLRPFHLSYYNAFAGGIRGANKIGMETTYWGDTLTRDALSYINQNAEENAGVAFYPIGELVVRMLKLTGALREDIRDFSAGDLHKADYLVLIQRQGMFTEDIIKIRESLVPEYTNGFDGVPFTEIYRLKPDK